MFIEQPAKWLRWLYPKAIGEWTRKTILSILHLMTVRFRVNSIHLRDPEKVQYQGYFLYGRRECIAPS